MTVGTRSVLFGAHAFWLHGFFVAAGWWRLYGFPWDVRLWLSFFFHDAGYIGRGDMDGRQGEEHVHLGAKIMGLLFGDSWAGFTLRHSRNWTQKHGVSVSRLCYADKLAFAITPGWLYLPMARATGELWEYMEKSRARQAGTAAFTERERAQIESGDPASWLQGLQSYTKRWVEERRGGTVAKWSIVIDSAPESQQGVAT